MVSNPGSTHGKVPPLNPINRDLFSPDPKTFVGQIDLFLQHGSRPEGPNPRLSMPPFGDTHSLTQQQIADIEAYILNLNGVNRATIHHPGIDPDLFFIIAAFAFSLIVINLWGWWWFNRLGKRKGKEAGE